MASPAAQSRRLVGLAADRPGAGKSTAASYLISHHGFSSVSIGAVVKAELDAMIRVHGFQYDEALKDEFRPALSWWTEFRITHSSQDYWLEKAIQLLPGIGPVLIPDVRYPNEANYIKQEGGIVIKVVRAGPSRSDLPSEVALEGYDFDHVINNDSDDSGAAMFSSLDKIMGVANERDSANTSHSTD